MEDLTYAKKNVLALKHVCGTYKSLYEKIYGKTPTRRDTQTFTNNINRSVFKAEFVILLIKAFNLYDVTLGEFYMGDITPKLQKAQSKKAALQAA